MIRISKEVLEENIDSIEEALEDFEYLVKELQKIEEEIENETKGDKVFPNMIEDIKKMSEDLEKLGVEEVSEIKGMIKTIVEEFTKEDEEIGREIDNGI
ncbi:MAG: hypothetical protein ACK5HR_04115 [Mycoplasmatales bacterium]